MTGQVVLITGAGSGIGRAAAERGHRVIAVGIDAGRLSTLAAEGQVLTFAGDVATAEANVVPHLACGLLHHRRDDPGGRGAERQRRRPAPAGPIWSPKPTGRLLADRRRSARPVVDGQGLAGRRIR
jgi:hypothetical protein